MTDGPLVSPLGEHMTRKDDTGDQTRPCRPRAESSHPRLGTESSETRQQLPNILISPTKLCSHQKRQKCHGGGALIAFRDDIAAESLDNLNSNCEIVWTKIHFARNKSIFFASYYRPPSDHLASLESLQASLTKSYRSQKHA